MTWLNTIEPVAAVAVIPYTCNVDIRTAYQAYLQRQVQLKQTTGKTVQGLLAAFDVYVRIWPSSFLITNSNSANIDQFVTKWSQKCTSFQAGRNGNPSRCLARLDLATCPMMNATANCPSFSAPLATSIEGYLGRLNRLFDWLLVERQIANNPVSPILRNMSRGNRAIKAKQSSAPNKRPYSDKEMRRLVTNTPPHIGIAVALGAKCLLRSHEIFKLDLSNFNFKERSFIIPNTDDYGNKRVGNRTIYYDGELERLLGTYLLYREHRAKRHDGTLKTTRLVVTYRGSAWTERSFNSSFNFQLNKWGKKLGIYKLPREGHSHDLRAHGCTKISAMHIMDTDLALLRGDVSLGSRGRYDLFGPRLAQLWHKYMPKLGI